MVVAHHEARIAPRLALAADQVHAAADELELALVRVVADHAVDGDVHAFAVAPVLPQAVAAMVDEVEAAARIRAEHGGGLPGRRGVVAGREDDVGVVASGDADHRAHQMAERLGRRRGLRGRRAGRGGGVARGGGVRGGGGGGGRRILGAEHARGEDGQQGQHRGADHELSVRAMRRDHGPTGRRGQDGPRIGDSAVVQPRHADASMR